MDPATIISLVNTGLTLLERGIKLRQDVGPLLGTLQGATAPQRTLADVEALEAMIKAQSSELQAEPPPEEP